MSGSALLTFHSGRRKFRKRSDACLASSDRRETFLFPFADENVLVSLRRTSHVWFDSSDRQWNEPCKKCKFERERNPRENQLHPSTTWRERRRDRCDLPFPFFSEPILLTRSDPFSLEGEKEIEPERKPKGGYLSRPRKRSNVVKTSIGRRSCSVSFDHVSQRIRSVGGTNGVWDRVSIDVLGCMRRCKFSWYAHTDDDGTEN